MLLIRFLNSSYLNYRIEFGIIHSNGDAFVRLFRLKIPAQVTKLLRDALCRFMIAILHETQLNKLAPWLFHFWLRILFSLARSHFSSIVFGTKSSLSGFSIEQMLSVFYLPNWRTYKVVIIQSTHFRVCSRNSVDSTIWNRRNRFSELFSILSFLYPMTAPSNLQIWIIFSL